MEDILEAYLMFLKRPWLKQTKLHHDWGNNILIIIVDTKTMTLSTKKWVMVHPSQRPCNLDDIYHWTNGNKECLYHDILELWHVGEVSPKELNSYPKYMWEWHNPNIILIIFSGIINMNLEKH
jgi:hypothetical protein